MSPSKQLVVLLHGAMRTRLSLLWIERALRKEGFETWNRSYPWRGRTLEEIADGLGERLAPFRERDLHFVTHSYGGIVARAYLARHRPENVRRMVNIAPPHRGSMLAKSSATNPALRRLYGTIYGKAAPQLHAAAIRKLPAPACEFGVIAGGRGRERGYSPLLPGDNDGVVLVRETKLRGMKDFVRVPHAHTFIMNGKDTIARTIRFLKEGVF